MEGSKRAIVVASFAKHIHSSHNSLQKNKTAYSTHHTTKHTKDHSTLNTSKSWQDTIHKTHNTTHITCDFTHTRHNNTDKIHALIYNLIVSVLPYVIEFVFRKFVTSTQLIKIIILWKLENWNIINTKIQKQTFFLEAAVFSWISLSVSCNPLAKVSLLYLLSVNWRRNISRRPQSKLYSAFVGRDASTSLRALVFFPSMSALLALHDLVFKESFDMVRIVQQKHFKMYLT